MPNGEPAPAPAGYRFVETSGGVSHFVLEANGLHVLVLPNDAAPVATFMITYLVGSRNEGIGLTGATHFLEHLMFKGTQRFNKASGLTLDRALQRVGAQLNATTWNDRTNYYELLPREHLPLAIDIEADRMRGALLDPKEMESERTVILNEYDRGDNEPFRKLYQTVWSVAYMAHPYHHPTIGWRSDIEQVTPAGLRGFYDTFYWPNNAVVSVIGDVETTDALNRVADHFGDIAASPHAIPTLRVQEPEQRGERRVVVKKAGELGTLMLAYKAPEALHPDATALDVLSVVLGSGKRSRLFRKLTDRGMTTRASASMSHFRDPGLFSLYAFLAPDKTHADVEAAVRETIREVQHDGVDADEIARARSVLHASEAFGRDGPYAVASQLNEAIAAGDWKLYTTYMDEVNRVTAADVQRVAQTYLLDDTCTVGYYIPEA
ncbi:MAG: pitrilysin family protein [Rhodothermales bacterium]